MQCRTSKQSTGKEILKKANSPLSILGQSPLLKGNQVDVWYRTMIISYLKYLKWQDILKSIQQGPEQRKLCTVFIYYNTQYWKYVSFPQSDLCSQCNPNKILIWFLWILPRCLPNAHQNAKYKEFTSQFWRRKKKLSDLYNHKLRSVLKNYNKDDVWQKAVYVNK